MLYHFRDFDAATPSHLIRLPNECTLYKFNLNFRRLETPDIFTFYIKELKHHIMFFSKSWSTIPLYFKVETPYQVFFKKLRHPIGFFFKKFKHPIRFFQKVETLYQFFFKKLRHLISFSKSWDTLSVFSQKLRHPISFFPKSWDTLSVFFSKS